MNFGWYADEAGASRLVHQALEAGINFFDTADVYSNGLSETYLGKALKGRRDQVILATKVGSVAGDKPEERGNHPKNIRRQVEASLRRLDTDYIDLYQLHHPDPDTPLEDSLGALNDLIRQGKIRYAGTTNFPAWQIIESQWLSRSHNLSPCISHQNSYSLLDRRAENEIIPACQKYRLGLIAWSPLAGGWLTKQFRPGKSPQPHPLIPTLKSPIESLDSKRHYTALAQLQSLAKSHGRKLSQFALAWVSANPAITLTLIGPQTPRQLKDSLGALQVAINPEEFAAIDEIVYPGSTVFI